MTLADAFRRALDVVGPKRLLFGSDSSFFPRGWVRSILETQKQALSEAGASSEMEQAILGDNLRSLIGFVPSK